MNSGGPSRGDEAEQSTGASRRRVTQPTTPPILKLPAPETAHRLLELANRFLDRLSRLQAIELKLSHAAAKRQERPGRRAARQVERERQRLGRELHTGVGQLLAAIRIQLELIEKQLPDPPAPIGEALERIRTLTAKAHAEVRGLSKQFYAPEWQLLALDSAIRQLWEATGVPQRFTSSIETATLPREPDPEIKTLLYRATQEALSNITRHASATRINLSLTVEGDRLHLTIRDNGAGFDPAQVFGGTRGIDAGIGLRSLREHAADLGGKFSIHSSPQGTTLEVFAPLDPL